MGMTRQRAARLAWGSLAASVAFAGATVLLAIRSGEPTAHLFTADVATNLQTPISIGVAVLAFPIVGALIATRRPENAIGWIFCAAGVILAFGNLASIWELHALETNPGSLPGGAVLGLLSDTLWIPSIAAVTVFLFALFPSGRPVGRLEKIALQAGAVAVVLALIGGLTEAHLYAAPSIENPLGLSRIGLITDVASGIGFFLLIAAIIVAVVSLIRRYRRARGEERLQLKWFVVSASFVVVVFVPSVTLEITPLLAIFGGIAAISVPVSVGVAILKYRLYDLDVVINKTVVYASLAAFITAVYVAIVAGIGSLVGQGDRPNVALSILATAIVAVAAQPVRARMQRVANRLVYGERASPYEVLTQLAERVGGEYATEDVLPRTARVIAEGTVATRADVWLRFGEELRLAARWPSGGENGAVPVPLNGDRGIVAIGDAGRSVPIFHQGELLGAIAVTKPPTEPFTPAEDKLLDDLASQAGLVLRNVGLTAELQARLEELSRQASALRASRQRIVAAQDAERKRLERNIHDGAQQHLVALAVKLRLAKTLVRTDTTKAAAMLAELRGETSEALETLRDLARGIYPPVLEEQGLAAALHAQVYRSGMRVTIEAEGLPRHPIETEAAIYFCCLEALQNAAKYAEASTVVVQLRENGDELAFSITDDGRGFDPDTVARGSGLQNMVDRVVALGGEVEVRSEPGHGTTVSGTVPSVALEIAR
jgi:signal transduction histidine kinase